MISSIFLPWITSTSWWFHYNGNLKDLMERTLYFIGSYSLNDFVKREPYQVIGIITCFIYLLGA